MKWGLVTTTNAPMAAVLDFAAYHLAMGAHRLWIFLDAPDPDTFAQLKPHPKIRVIVTDDAYWAKKGKRPDMHQPRQSANARHAYRRARDVDWLGHIDIDEFLWPDSPFAAQLGALPADCAVARIRPVEALAAPDPAAPTYFKATPIDRKERARLTAMLYPDYAGHLEDGFLSHVAGKIFIRTGRDDVRIKIHNATIGAETNPGQVELAGTTLCHMHAESWEDWRARFDYRLDRGAYRAELGRTGPSGLTLHAFFKALIADGGEAALQRFYTQICNATPAHIAALDKAGLLRRRDLQLLTHRKQHFPSAPI